MRSSTFVILAGAVFARSTFAYTFVGCIDYDDVPSGTDVSSEVTSLDTCLFTCTGLGTAYGIYQSSANQCVCTASEGANSIFVASQDASGTCDSDNGIVYKLSTSFEFITCATQLQTSGTTYTTFTSDLADCFTACSSWIYTSYSRISSNHICVCSNTATVVDPEPCDSSNAQTLLVYDHTSAAAASGLARRTLRRRLELAKRAQGIYCPPGLTSCSIGDDPNAYECVDTYSDLESCGGCLNGLYPSSSNVTTGQDCSALPGVAMGGVTCLRGSCQVSACKSGYTLIDNECVLL